MTAPCEPDPGVPPSAAPTAVADEVAAWAASGAMWLTGPPDGDPLGPPAGLVPRLRAVAAPLTIPGIGAGEDPVTVLGQRAAVAGLRRQGTTSCGGGTRLLPAGDRWLAVSLARPTDVELVPAWLEADVPAGPEAAPWSAVAARVAAARTPPALERLLERAHLLGLPVAALPEGPPPAPVAPLPLAPLPLRATAVAGGPADPLAPRDRLAGLVVVDLSSLWAGPLAGSILAAAGATVVKVESTGRPDGARRGPAAFFDLLNAGKRGVAVDLATRDGARVLHELLARADVVIEASRPRALEQLGIDAPALLATRRPRVWVSITGHGRTGAAGDRVGFGDDAAVAGGLVCWHDGRPHFCADAVADPASGLVAAAGVLDALAAGGRWLLDVALSGVAAHLAGPTLAVDAGDPAGRAPAATPPHAPANRGRAPRLGEHTASVLAELGVGA